jgi:hypothetical protein
VKKLLIIISFFILGFQFTIAQSRDQNENTTIRETQKIKVFPNPAANVINILGLQNSNRAEIVITDTYGNPVLRHRWSITNNALNIPITSLKSGIYMVTIRSEEQQVQTKFYKQ